MIMATSAIGQINPRDAASAGARRQTMSTLYELRAAQYEYERRLRDAEHDRQVKRLENANGKVVTNRVVKVVRMLATVLGLKSVASPGPRGLRVRWLVNRRT